MFNMFQLSGEAWPERWSFIVDLVLGVRGQIGLGRQERCRSVVHFANASTRFLNYAICLKGLEGGKVIRRPTLVKL